MFVLYFIYLRLYLFFISLFQIKKNYRTHHKPKVIKCFKNNKKPDWVVNKIIYFKAMMPKVSGYKITDIFNLQYTDIESVSKTYVYNTIRKYHYAILIERKISKTESHIP